MNIWHFDGSAWTQIPEENRITVNGRDLSAASAFARYGRAVCATAGYYEEFLAAGLPPFSDPVVGEIEGEPRAVRQALGVATDPMILRTQAHERVLAAIYQKAAERLEAVAPHYHPLEVETFADQAAEARAFKTDAVVGPYMLRRLPDAYTADQADDLATRILARKTTQDGFLAEVQIAREAHRNALQALFDANATPAAIEAYDYSQGWPEVPQDPLAL